LLIPSQTRFLKLLLGRSGQERERAYCLKRVRRYLGKMEGVRRKWRRRMVRTVAGKKRREECQRWEMEIWSERKERKKETW